MGDPRQLERWWGPPSWPATFTQHELTPGGQSRYHMTGPAGEKAPGWWSTVDTQPPVRLIVEDGFARPDGEPDPAIPTMRMEVSFEPISGGTRMTILTLFTDIEQLEKVDRHGHGRGYDPGAGTDRRSVGRVENEKPCKAKEDEMSSPPQPCLWFAGQAREAMQYYVDTFPNSRILSVEEYPDESLDEHFTGMAGKVMNGRFTLNGTDFTCLDGGAAFTFNESISFVISCVDQAEIDKYWTQAFARARCRAVRLVQRPVRISWQIIPAQLGELLQRPEQVQTMMRQKKIVIAELQNA